MFFISIIVFFVSIIMFFVSIIVFFVSIIMFFVSIIVFFVNIVMFFVSIIVFFVSITIDSIHYVRGGASENPSVAEFCTNTQTLRVVDTVQMSHEETVEAMSKKAKMW